MWIVILLAVLFVLMYNQLIRESKQVDNAFSTVDVFLKKRYDLIPNLVNTVKGYAVHEKEVFERIAIFRNEAMLQKSQNELVKLDNAITSSLMDVFALAEDYPDLIASENFLSLQKSLEKMEDELLAARRTYNAAVTEYNISLDTFPTNLVAKIFKLQKKELFIIDENVKENIKVDF